MNEHSLISVFDFADLLLARIKTYANEQLDQNFDNFSVFDRLDDELLDKYKISVLFYQTDIVKWKSKHAGFDTSDKIGFDLSEIFNITESSRSWPFSIVSVSPQFYAESECSFVHQNKIFEHFYLHCVQLNIPGWKMRVVFHLSKFLFKSVDSFSQILLAKEMFDSTEEMYFMVDKKGAFILKNKAFINFEKHLFALADERILAEWHKNLQTHIGKIIESKQKLEIELKYRIKDIKTTLRCQYIPFYLLDELIVIATYKDISDQAKIKSKLVRELSFLHKFLEYSNIGYLFFDERNSLIAYINRDQQFLPGNILHVNHAQNVLLEALKEQIDNTSFERLSKLVYSSESKATVELNLVLQNAFLKITKSQIAYKKDIYTAFSLENISDLKRQTFALERQNKFFSILAMIGNDLLTIHSLKDLYRSLNSVLSNTLGDNYFIFSFQYEMAGNILLDNAFVGENVKQVLKADNLNIQTGHNVAGFFEPQNISTKLMQEFNDVQFLKPFFKHLGLNLPSKHLFDVFLGQFADQDKRYYCTLIGSLEKSDEIMAYYLESVFNQYFGRLISINQLNQIIEQRETAINLSKAKSDFVSNITHEIKNPMNSILGFSRLLEKRDIEPKAKDYASIIRKNSEQLLKIIQDLSDISKIESNTLKINMEEFDLMSLIHELKDLYIHYKDINEKVQLYFDFNDEAQIFIYADFIRLKQILINFISNALKYTPDGYIKVSYHLLPENKINIFVEDTGPGISPEDSKKIFNRYERAQAKLINKEGVGIGLSIAQELARKMDTEIVLQTEMGVGSVFSIMFNVTAEHKEPLETGLDLNPIQGRKLMVVEDDINTIQFYNFFFSEMQISFVICKNAFEAEKMIKTELPDLVFCDIRMPGKNGLEFYEDNRSCLSEIPFYFITADSSVEIKNQAVNMGVCDIIYKPIDPQKIKQILIKHQFEVHDIL